MAVDLGAGGCVGDAVLVSGRSASAEQVVFWTEFRRKSISDPDPKRRRSAYNSAGAFSEEIGDTQDSDQSGRVINSAVSEWSGLSDGFRRYVCSEDPEFADKAWQFGRDDRLPFILRKRNLDIGDPEPLLSDVQQCFALLSFSFYTRS